MKKVGQIVRENFVSQIKNNIAKRNNTFVVSCPSLSGAKMNDLRKSLSKVGASLHVSRNSLAQRALNDGSLNKISESLEKQTGFIWSDADCIEISKAIVKLGKDFEGFKVYGGVWEGKPLQGEDVKRLADLPSRTVLLTMLVTSLQSPLSRLAGVLNAKTRDLVSILKQLSEKKVK